jgi:hypothetical protein
MKKVATGGLVVLAAFVSAAPLVAHHSLANFDTAHAVRVKGTIVQIHHINPHSFIFVEVTTADGQTRRWAVEGPSLLQLNRQGRKDVLKPGDVVDVCGSLPKEALRWQIASADATAASPAGRLINAEVLTMPDGTQQSWGDYGVHKCFAPGYTDQHSSR